jgi:intracellular multiplication protein IcmV
MKIFTKTKNGVKRVLGVKELTNNYVDIKEIAKGFYDYNTQKIEPTGKMFYVPAAFLEKREREFRNLVILFGSIFVLGVLYFFYALLHMMWEQSVIIFLFCLFISALCFRYHFWYIQVKKRKLGCTFKEWKEETLKELSKKKGDI